MPWTIPNLVLHDKPVSLANMRSHGRKHVDGRRAHRRVLLDLHFNADWSFQIAAVRAPRPYLRYSNSRWPQCQASVRRFDPTNTERAQMGSRYRRSWRRVDPALIK